MPTLSKIFASFIFFGLTLSCSSPSSSPSIPYQTGQSYQFKTTVLDSNSTVLIVDTLTLTIHKKGIIGALLGMNMAKWTSVKYPYQKETRGVNLTANSVDIQMPLQFDFLENENIVIAGYPSFSNSMAIGTTTISNHHFPKSYGKLAGNEIDQYKIVVDSAIASYKGQPVPTQVAQYKNLTGVHKFGAYELQTFYSTEFGFLKMNYTYPNHKTITFELIDIINTASK